jgi:hypothetical protein
LYIFFLILKNVDEETYLKLDFLEDYFDRGDLNVIHAFQSLDVDFFEYGNLIEDLL